MHFECEAPESRPGEFIGYPLTKYLPGSIKSELEIHGVTLERFKKYDTLEEAKNNGHEFILEEGKNLNVYLNRNETLIQTLAPFRGNTENFIVIFIDAISRV